MCEEPNGRKVIIDQTSCSIGNITGLLCVVLPHPGFFVSYGPAMSVYPPPVPVQLSSSKAVQVHLHSLSSSGIVKELMSGPSPAWWHFSLCREML